MCKHSRDLSSENHKKPSWKHRLHEVIYEADTPAGKLFDVILLIAILVSVLFVMLESIDTVATEYGDLLNTAEWVITILFSIEYRGISHTQRVINLSRVMKGRNS